MTEQEIARAIVQAVELNKTISYVDKWGKSKQIKLVDIFDYIAKTSKDLTLSVFAKMLKAKAMSNETIDETLKEMED